MDIFVDYYNVSSKHRRSGLVDVVERIVSAVVPDYLDSDDKRVNLRLYGGWYEDQKPTRDAQSLSQSVTENYPSAIRSNSRFVIVSVELAYSMKCDPSHHLWYTLRSKTAPRGIVFQSPQSAGCVLPDRCPLHPSYDFFVRGECPEQDCLVKSSLVLRRREQKLVDTMLAADLFYSLQLSSEKQVVLVSSDDDLWPVIKTALQLGLNVIHIHTEKGYATRPDYVRGVGAGYMELNLQEEIR